MHGREKLVEGIETEVEKLKISRGCGVVVVGCIGRAVIIFIDFQLLKVFVEVILKVL